jgi:hypothetical protein
MYFFLFPFLFLTSISLCSEVENRFMPLNDSSWEAAIDFKTRAPFKSEEWQCIPPTQLTPDMQGTLWKNNANQYLLMGTERGKCGELIDAKAIKFFMAYDRNPWFTVVLQKYYSDGNDHLTYFSLIYPRVDRYPMALKDNFKAKGLSTAPDYSSVAWSESDEICIVDIKNHGEFTVLDYERTYHKIPCVNPRIVLKQVKTNSFFVLDNEGQILYQLGHSGEQLRKILDFTFRVPAQTFIVNNIQNDKSFDYATFKIAKQKQEISIWAGKREQIEKRECSIYAVEAPAENPYIFFDANGLISLYNQKNIAPLPYDSFSVQDLVTSKEKIAASGNAERDNFEKKISLIDYFKATLSGMMPLISKMYLIGVACFIIKRVIGFYLNR